MPDTDTTLTLIDGALHDWDTSPDAMRWTPDAKPAADPIDGISMAQLAEGFQLLHDTLTHSLSSFFANCSAVFAELADAIGPMLEHAAQHEADAEARPSWHERRCPTCNPRCANTAPWTYGPEYQRRRKARARRNRHR